MKKMAILNSICTFLFSLPFLVLLLANIASYFSIDIESKWKSFVFTLIEDQGVNSRANQLMLLSTNIQNSLTDYFQTPQCSSYRHNDTFQGLSLYMLFDQQFVDVQGDIYSIAKDCISEVHRHLVFPPEAFTRRNDKYWTQETKFIDFSEYSSNVTLFKERNRDWSENGNRYSDEWTIIEMKNNSLIQYIQLYDESNVEESIDVELSKDSESNESPDGEFSDVVTVNMTEASSHFSQSAEKEKLSKARKQSIGKECSYAYRSAMIIRSNYTLTQIIHLLSTWEAMNVFFMTRSQNVSILVILLFSN
jgi:hypothetical protein